MFYATFFLNKSGLSNRVSGTERVKMRTEIIFEKKNDVTEAPQSDVTDRPVNKTDNNARDNKYYISFHLHSLKMKLKRNVK